MQRNAQPKKPKSSSRYTIFSLLIIIAAGLVAQIVTKNKEKQNVNNQNSNPVSITTEDQTTEDNLTIVEVTTTESTPQTDASSEEATTTEEVTTEAPQAKHYTFRYDSYRKDHFSKHGGEFEDSFGYDTPEAYEEGANRVINDPNALHKIESEDGDDIFYLEASNEFVVVSTDGYIRTYFRPSAGIDYYNRQ